MSDVNRHNVNRLSVAWVVRSGEIKTHTTPPHEFAGAGVAFRDLVCAACGGADIRFEVTPVQVNGRLLLSTPFSRVIALEPSSGAVIWTFDPKIDLDHSYGEGFTSRGIAVWSGAPSSNDCSSRVFLATLDGRLVALDQTNGGLCAGFGSEGIVNLTASGLANSRLEVTSPPIVVGSTVIVGSSHSVSGDSAPTRGVVQAFDARTGASKWEFRPLDLSTTTSGGGNVWTLMTADPKADLVFLATASAAPNHYGGSRPGSNVGANSVIAVRASTGSVVWQYQLVRHDLWDYDIAAPPVVASIKFMGTMRDVVIVGTKMGTLFALDRATGVPLHPVADSAVAASHVPGETAAPTQPFSSYPSLHGLTLSPDSVFGINAQDRAFCRRAFESFRYEGLFTPPSEVGSILWPGVWGGINWDGLAWDPRNERLVALVKRVGMVVRLRQRNSSSRTVQQEGAQYSETREPLVGRSGLPCTPPPWSLLAAFDFKRSAIVWQKPVGIIPSLAHLPQAEHWGSLAFGGPLLTAGGLAFVASSQDDMLRAFDARTGAQLWEHRLPAGGQAAPMSYRFGTRQYIVIVAGGRGGIGSMGDWIVAFSLPNSASMSR